MNAISALIAFNYRLAFLFGKVCRQIIYRILLRGRPNLLAGGPLGCLLAGQKLTGVDVGGAVDLQPHWYWFLGNMNFVIFEPNEQACKELRAHYDRLGHGPSFRILPSGLSRNGGTQTLYVFNEPTGSTLKKMNETNPYFSAKDPYRHPIRPTPIKTQTLREALDEIGMAVVDAIKLDIQGSELDVLRGLDESRLGTLLVVELEQNMRDMHLDGASFAETHAFMEKQGLELYDVRTARDTRQWGGGRGDHEAEVLGAKLGSASFSAKLWEFDLIYFRSPLPLLAKRDAAALRRLIACFCVHRFFLEGVRITEMARDTNIFTATEAADCLEALRALHRLSRAETSIFQGVLDAQQNQVWSQYMWSGYPSS